MQYEAKLFKLLDDYDKAYLFNADNVGSKQFMDIRAVRCLVNAVLDHVRLLDHLHCVLTKAKVDWRDKFPPKVALAA
jgi:hypothetical protein